VHLLLGCRHWVASGFGTGYGGELVGCACEVGHMVGRVVGCGSSVMSHP
jgi:hypothetical protein